MHVFQDGLWVCLVYFAISFHEGSQKLDMMAVEFSMGAVVITGMCFVAVREFWAKHLESLYISFLMTKKPRTSRPYSFRCPKPAYLEMIIQN